MALKQYNGRFCEQDFENALISMFEAVNWHYLFGDDIQRSGGTEVLILDDLRNFLAQENPFLTPDEVADLVNRISLVGAESDFATLHRVYTMLVDGVQFTPQDGQPRMIHFINFEKGKWDHNTFRVVNQFTVDYTNNGQRKNRRPDLLLYVNGIPLCVIELKNPGNENTTIADAYTQINTRYWRDIPHLLQVLADVLKS